MKPDLKDAGDKPRPEPAGTLRLDVAEALFRMDCGTYQPQSRPHSYFRNEMGPEKQAPYLKLADHIIRIVQQT